MSPRPNLPPIEINFHEVVCINQYVGALEWKTIYPSPPRKGIRR